MNTALILAILDTQAKLATTLIASQTPAQQAVLWDRYIQLTAPLHALLIKIENLVTPSATPATAQVPAVKL